MTSKVLSEFLITNIGGGWGSEKRTETNTEKVAVIRGTDIPKLLTGDYSSVPIRYETKTKLKSRRLTRGDLILEVSGGSAASGQHTGRALVVTQEMIDQLGGEVIPASFCKLLRFDSKQIVPDYLKFQIDLMHLTKEIVSYENQSTGISNFQTTHFLNSIEPLIKDLNDQKNSSNVLLNLNSKIMNLKNVNKTLESIGLLIFKSWFIDFDFTKTSRAKFFDASGDSLFFPKDLVECELGVMPFGWKISTVGNEFKLTMGQSPSGDTYNSTEQGIEFYQGRTDFGFRFPLKRIFCTEPTRFAAQGDILVSVRAPVGDVNVAFSDCCIGRGLAGIRHPLNYQSYALYVMKSLHNSFKVFDGEGTIFGSITKSNFENIKIISPPNNVIEAFERVVKPLDDRVKANEVMLRTLTALRDALLPNLISGEIKVT